jgi:hypothetical protein
MAVVGVAIILLRTGFAVSVFVGFAGAAQALDARSDTDIQKLIIAESIASYPGPCACPYHVVRNGSSCGKRSACSRPGGYEPKCYDTDITAEMVLSYRQKHKVGN